MKRTNVKDFTTEELESINLYGRGNSCGADGELCITCNLCANLTMGHRCDIVQREIAGRKGNMSNNNKEISEIKEEMRTLADRLEKIENKKDYIPVKEFKVGKWYKYHGEYDEILRCDEIVTSDYLSGLRVKTYNIKGGGSVTQPISDVHLWEEIETPSPKIGDIVVGQRKDIKGAVIGEFAEMDDGLIPYRIKWVWCEKIRLATPEEARISV